MDTYAQAKTELTEIDQKIASLQKRRVDLAKFVELGALLYQSDQSPESKAAAESFHEFAARTMLQVEAGPTARAKATSAKMRILSAAWNILRDAGPLRTREILSRLTAQGVEVAGADPAQTLSVLLSKSDLFRADRSIGWSIVESHVQKETPQDVAASAGSES